MWIHFFQSPIIAYPWQLLVDGLIWAMLLKAQKLNFCQDFECKGWSKFWSWILINLLYDLKTVNSVRTLDPCGRCSFCNVCILWCKVKERNDDAPDNYNNPVHLVHQADLNALAQARVGRWWILRREGRTGNHHHHQLTSLFSTPLPSESPSSSSATPSALSTHFYPLHKSLYFLRKLNFFLSRSISGFELFILSMLFDFVQKGHI